MAENLKKAIRKKITQDNQIDISSRQQMNDFLENQTLLALSKMNKLPNSELRMFLINNIKKKSTEKKFSRTATRTDDYNVRNWSLHNQERPTDLNYDRYQYSQGISQQLSNNTNNSQQSQGSKQRPHTTQGGRYADYKTDSNYHDIGGQSVVPSHDLNYKSDDDPLQQYQYSNNNAQFKKNNYVGGYSQNSEINTTNPVGQINVANVCYLNCLIQTLFHIPKFTQTMLQMDFDNKEQNVKFFKDSAYDLHLSFELANLFRIMAKRGQSVADPRNLCKYFCDENNQVIEFGEHRDVSEFLNQMINQIKKFIVRYQENYEKIQNMNNNMISFDLDYMKGVFVTLDEMIKKPIDMSKIRNQKNDFEGFSINIDSDKTFAELMEESIVTKTENKSFKQWIVVPPKILPVTINRFTMLDNGNFEKNNSYIQVDPHYNISRHLAENSVLSTDLKLLEDKLKDIRRRFRIVKDHFDILEEFYKNDGAAYDQKEVVLKVLNEKASILKAQIQEAKEQIEALKTSIKPVNYTQFSAIMHTGQLTFGHYFCYIKKGNTWYLCNDQEVIGDKSEDFVLRHIGGDGTGNANGYILFYCRDDFCNINQLKEMVESYKHIEPLSLKDMQKGGNTLTPAPRPNSQFANSPNQNSQQRSFQNDSMVNQRSNQLSASNQESLNKNQSNVYSNPSFNTMNNPGYTRSQQFTNNNNENYRPVTAQSTHTNQNDDKILGQYESTKFNSFPKRF